MSPDSIPVEIFTGTQEAHYLVLCHRNLKRPTLFIFTKEKILTQVMLNQLTDQLGEKILPDSQCVFHPGDGTSEMIFALVQTKNKCCEQSHKLYVIYFDFAKAFDSVN